MLCGRSSNLKRPALTKLPDPWCNMRVSVRAPYDKFYDDLRPVVPVSRLLTDPLRTLAYGTDASFYRLIPQIVVLVQNEAEVVHVLQTASKHELPVTFRAAGTSICGQAISDSILVVLGHDGWRGHEINEDASEIRLQPGVIGGRANRYLAPYHRKIGPDPASINACMIGGIAANNSSGMCCSVDQNSYRTLVSMRMVLADGHVLDTGDETSRKIFLQRHKVLLDDIGELAADVRANRSLAERIREKFRIRNTTGYSLNALVDFDDPIDILQHLLIGSEGTLGFISNITYRTVEEHSHKATALMVFADVKTACEVVTILQSQQMSAVELMDRACLRAVENKPGLPDYLAGLPEDAAALLVETRATDSETLHAQVSGITSAVCAKETLQPIQFTDKPEEYEQIWNVRRGLYPSVGAMRATGTSVITEDLVFPVDRLALAVLDLRGLLQKYEYDDAMILGHALQGNIHIVFSQAFTSEDEIARYQQLLADITKLVVERYDGSLKGEHGTGRNMAPFVEFEWGAEAYALMRRIKTLLDPKNILNPGVILNEDPRAHLKNFKPLYPADPLVDKCIECGMCESACPSAALTLSPRQRITSLREIARLSETGEDAALEAKMQKLFRYQAVDTCAGDGLCATACPVGIDTGKMMKEIRGRDAGRATRKLAGLAARNFATTTRIARLALSGASLAHKTLGTPRMQRLADTARRLSGDRLPAWNPYTPASAGKIRLENDREPAAPRLVYFPACSSRAMGPAQGDPECEPLPAKAQALFRKAGFAVTYPERCEQLCCGMAFESKGVMREAEVKLIETEKALLTASRDGRDPVVTDTSPCALRLKQHLDGKLKLLDIAEFIHDHALTRLSFTKQPDTVAVHATCSTRKMGLQQKLEHIARLCAEEVVVPDDIACCGWGGDKGFTQPELNASAVRTLAGALPDDCVAGYSTSRTCEIGLSHHSERYYRSIVYLVDRCTTSRSSHS